MGERDPSLEPELTPLVVIGTGLSGLAMGTELDRNKFPCTVISGLKRVSPAGEAATSSMPALYGNQVEAWKSRVEIIRHLESYARTHRMDLRKTVHVDHLEPVPASPNSPNADGARWLVHTDHGVLRARDVVVAGQGTGLSHVLQQGTGEVHATEKRAAKPSSSAQTGQLPAMAGLYVIGRTLGNGKAPFKEVLGQVRRVMEQLQESRAPQVGAPGPRRMFVDSLRPGTMAPGFA